MSAHAKPQILDPKIFREYDIRGTYGKTLSADIAHTIGRATAQLFREQGGQTMAIGRDGRLSSPALAKALIEGLRDGGVNVLDIGLSSTPMLYYAEASTPEVQGGIEVTGSHNPADDNGFKIVFGGRALFGAEIRRIGILASQMFGQGVPVESKEIGRGFLQHRQVLGGYVARLLEALGAALGRHGEKAASLRIGWDTGNGAGGPVLEALIPLLPGEHHLLFAEVNGHFPHHHPDPTDEANLADLRSLVASRRLDFGLAFDGDADRLVVIDGQGRSLLGDQLLALLAEDLLQTHPQALILADVKSSQMLFDHVAQCGGHSAIVPAGHSLVKSKMKQTGALLAGETTGHIFYADQYYGFDDAFYAALRLIAALLCRDESLAQWRDRLPLWVNTPELRFPVDPARKTAIIAEIAQRLAAQGATVDHTDGLRVSRPQGWWLLRASNTQDMLTARAESRTPSGLATLLAEIDSQLAQSGITRA
jgi:phosphomannomutase